MTPQRNYTVEHYLYKILRFCESASHLGKCTKTDYIAKMFDSLHKNVRSHFKVLL